MSYVKFRTDFMMELYKRVGGVLGESASIEDVCSAVNIPEEYRRTAVKVLLTTGLITNVSQGGTVQISVEGILFCENSSM